MEDNHETADRFRRTFGLALAAPAGAQQPIVIKFSHVAAPDTPKGQAANEFKRLAEERTKGRVKVEVYPNSQLFKDAEELDGLQLGSVQMLAPVPGKFGPAGIPEFEVFDLPYMFPDLDALQRIYDGPAGATLLKKLEAKGHGRPRVLEQRLSGDEREPADPRRPPT